MQKVLTGDEVREVDRLTTEKYGIPSLLLMENAAHAAARVIAERLGGEVAGKSVLILCGKGNNGGDGAALARILAFQGAFVEVVLFAKVSETEGDANTNFNICGSLSNAEGVSRQSSSNPDYFNVFQLTGTGGLSFKECLDEHQWDEIFNPDEGQNWNCIIDSIFGFGFKGSVNLMYATVFCSINRWNEARKEVYKEKSLVVSIDIPSGITADLSQPLVDYVESNLTITFTAPKLANVLPPASNFGGELVVANIGSPQELIDNSPSRLFLAERQDAQDWLYRTKYTSDSYKNKRGHALLIVGSKQYSGAAVLAGNAAMVSGVGLTTIATSESARSAIAAKVSEEVITHGLPETKAGAVAAKAFEAIEELTEKVDVVGIGCGLSSAEKSTKNFVRAVVERRKTPVVVDADALNALAPFDLQGSEDLPIILTPHEGEFLRLLGAAGKDVLKDRVKAARDFAAKHNVILVLKGERVLIAAPDGKVVINPTGNSGLGKAGNGDTLTGVITGFVAQAAQMKTGVFETVVAAVYISSLAGDIAAEKFGKRAMLASDVRACLGEAFERLENGD